MEPVTVEQMYGDWPIAFDEREAVLDRSLAPRPASSLFEVVVALGLDPETRVLDAGARDARYSIELHERLGAEVVALEPVAANLRAAHQRVEAAGYADEVQVIAGRLEAIPADDQQFGLVFCRDVLSHVENLASALTECNRVLAPGGQMVSYQTFATDLLEPLEAARIYSDLAVIPGSMDPGRFEREALSAGFAIEIRDVIGSEWREAWEEDGTGTTSRQLLHAARLLRAREELRSSLGDIPYRVELSNALWGVYQMIGKLEPRIYVLRKKA